MYMLTDYRLIHSSERAGPRVGLRWPGPAPTVNYIPVLSSERALKERRLKKNWSRVSDGCLTLRRTGRLTVGLNVTLTLTLTSGGYG
jgi:hypothetical protein